MNLLSELAIGGGMIAATVVVHAITMDIIMSKAAHLFKALRGAVGHLARPAIASIIVVTLFLAHVINI